MMPLDVFLRYRLSSVLELLLLVLLVVVVVVVVVETVVSKRRFGRVSIFSKRP